MSVEPTELGLILDCDGVLLDSMGAWEQAEIDACATVGIHPTKEDIDHVNTLTLIEACEYYHEKYGAGGSVEETLRIIDESMQRFYSNDVVVEPGALDFVRTLHDKGVCTCVVSSSPLRYLQAGLGSCGFLPYLDDVLSADELGFTKREHPIYDKALEVLGTDKENTWGFDDTSYALKTLNSVGCHSVGIYSSDMNSSVERLRSVAEYTYAGGLEELTPEGFLRLAGATSF